MPVALQRVHGYRPEPPTYGRFFLAFGDNPDHNNTGISAIDNLDGESKRDTKVEPNQRLRCLPRHQMRGWPELMNFIKVADRIVDC